jgi:acetyl-CoA acetyltransferase
MIMHGYADMVIAGGAESLTDIDRILLFKTDARSAGRRRQGKTTTRPKNSQRLTTHAPAYLAHRNTRPLRSIQRAKAWGRSAERMAKENSIGAVRAGSLGAALAHSWLPPATADGKTPAGD